LLQTFPLGSSSLVWYLGMQAFFFFLIFPSWALDFSDHFCFCIIFGLFFLSLLTNWFLDYATYPPTQLCIGMHLILRCAILPIVLLLLCVATFFLSFFFLSFFSSFYAFFTSRVLGILKIDVHFEDATWNVQEECEIQVQYLEHLQRCSVCDPAKILYSFATPPIKLKLGHQIGWGTTNCKPLGRIIMMGQWGTLSSS